MLCPAYSEHWELLYRWRDSVAEYASAARIHDGLGKDTLNQRPVEDRPRSDARVISLPRLGGLHHRYGWQRAA